MTWSITTIGEVAAIDRQGVSPDTVSPSTYYIGLEHINSVNGIQATETVESAKLRSTKFLFTASHILFGKLRPYLCKIARPTINGICSTDILPILPGDELDAGYLYYFLRQPSQVELATRRSSGANLPRLSPKELAKFEIPLPPIAEQKRIAGILDAADALRVKRRDAISSLDTLLQSTFLTLFGDPVTNPMGWEIATLPEVALKFTDGPFGSNLKSSHYVEDGVRVIRLQNIGIGEMLNDDIAFISTEHFESLPRNHCQPGDIVIGTLGDPNLRACILPHDLEKSLNKADCILMRADEKKAKALYICWLLNCPATVAKALELVRGQTRGRISMGRLKGLLVPLPPLDLQQHFATIVKSIEKQKAQQRAHLVELDTLFASLQSRAFKGEL